MIEFIMNSTFYDFFNSDFVQNIILILTVVTTLWIYYANQRKQRKYAATNLILQIKDIEKNIEFLLSEGLSKDVIQQRPLHYSILIFNEDYWSKYSHLMVGNLSQLAYEIIDNFYKVAYLIREQQNIVKNKIQQSLEYRGLYYYSGVYSRFNIICGNDKSHESCQKDINAIANLYSSPDLNVVPFMPEEVTFGLTQSLKKYHKLTDGIAYSELQKIAK